MLAIVVGTVAGAATVVESPPTRPNGTVALSPLADSVAADTPAPTPTIDPAPDEYEAPSAMGPEAPPTTHVCRVLYVGRKPYIGEGSSLSEACEGAGEALQVNCAGYWANVAVRRFAHALHPDGCRLKDYTKFYFDDPRPHIEGWGTAYTHEAACRAALAEAHARGLPERPGRYGWRRLERRVAEGGRYSIPSLAEARKLGRFGPTLSLEEQRRRRAHSADKPR